MSHIEKETPKPFEVSYNPTVFRMLQKHLRMANLITVISVVVSLPWLLYGLIAMPFGVVWTTVSMALLGALIVFALVHRYKVNADYMVEARDQVVVSKAYSLFSSWASRPGDQQRKQLERLDFTVDVEPVTKGGFDLRVVVSPLTEMKTPDITRASQEYIVTTTGFHTVAGYSLEKVLPGLEHALTHVDTFGGFGQQVSMAFRATEIPEVSVAMSEARALRSDD